MPSRSDWTPSVMTVSPGFNPPSISTRLTRASALEIFVLYADDATGGNRQRLCLIAGKSGQGGEGERKGQQAQGGKGVSLASHVGHVVFSGLATVPGSMRFCAVRNR